MAGYIENSRRFPKWPAPIGYPTKLAGVPDALIFFCFFSSIKTRKGPLPRAGKFGRVHREQPKVPNLAGVPDALIFFCFFSSIKTRKGPLPRAGKFGRVHREQSKVSNLAGVPDALIFFCFFSCIKARKEDHEARESCIKARKAEGREVWPGTSRTVEGLQLGRRLVRAS